LLRIVACGERKISTSDEKKEDESDRGPTLRRERDKRNHEADLREQHTYCSDAVMTKNSSSNNKEDRE
jgi:hypothetical protein